MVKTSNWNWKGAGALLCAAGLAFTISGCNSGGKETLATVGGQSITRAELNQHLEATHGPEALQQLIDYTLVIQNLKSKGLEVSDAEVTAAIAERQSKEPEIAKIVQAGDGPRLRALQRQTRYQLAIDKLLTQDVKVDENGLKAWFEKTREYYDKPESVRFGAVSTSTKTRADVMEKQLKSNQKSFLEIVQEQQKANDPAARSSIAEVPSLISVPNLPENIHQTLSKLKKGETSGVVTITQPGPDGNPLHVYTILRLIERQPAQKADFAKLRSQIEEDYKLEQVARRVVAQIPNVSWEEILPQVRDQVASGQPTPPTYSEILRFIITQLPTVPSVAQFGVQSPAAQLVQSLRTSSNVVINDPDYQPVGEMYKTVPGVTGSAPADNAAPADGAAPAGNAAPAANAAPAGDAAPAGNAAP